jgi:hypothetical protein
VSHFLSPLSRTCANAIGSFTNTPFCDVQQRVLSDTNFRLLHFPAIFFRDCHRTARVKQADSPLVLLELTLPDNLGTQLCNKVGPVPLQISEELNFDSNCWKNVNNTDEFCVLNQQSDHLNC